MNINKLKEILYKYPSDLIIKAQIDNEVIYKLEYSKMIGGAGLQIMGDYYICDCKPITVSELLNNLKEDENSDNIILFENVIDYYSEDITYKKYDIKEVVQKDDSLILIGAYIGTEIYQQEIKMSLLQQHTNITGQIRMHIRTELKEKYDDIEFDDGDETSLLCFDIGCWNFVIDVVNNYFRIEYFNETVRDDWNSDYLETFEELFKYIDDVISEEA
ncbi:hypothetical protein [Brachyspira pilosicoli]|uniref:hypothetical protein n=1 Tax=Brachyspira pilosicoli TaxID=52584 RepID=UPI00255CC2F5|nr:hypothetical protein [Brachyspira pilosicoli]